MQSYRSRPSAGPCFSIDELTSYRFFADFLEERFFADDFALLLLARARLAAVDADFVFAADLFADFFLLEDLLALRCLRSFSVAI